MKRIVTHSYSDVTRLKQEYEAMLLRLICRSRRSGVPIEPYGRQGGITRIYDELAHAGLYGCLLLAGFGEKTAAIHISIPDYTAGLLPKAIRELVTHCSPQAHYAVAGILPEDTSRMMFAQVRQELAKHGAVIREVNRQSEYSVVVIDPREGKLHVFKRA